MIAALATGSPAAAGEAPVPSFEGRCEVYGAVSFQRLVTTEVAQHTYEFRTADDLSTCAGKLRYGDKLIGDRAWPARFVVRGTGAVSCQKSTVTGGDGRFEFLSDGEFEQLTTRDASGVHPLTVEARVDIEHVLNSVAGTVFGARGSQALARATFLPTPEAIQACGEKGIRSLPFSATVFANARLFGLRSRTLDTMRPRVGRVMVRKRSVRFRLSEAAEVTVGVRRRGRLVMRKKLRAKAGANLVRTPRRLRGRRYRVTIRAADASGNATRFSRRVRRR